MRSQSVSILMGEALRSRVLRNDDRHLYPRYEECWCRGMTRIGGQERRFRVAAQDAPVC